MHDGARKTREVRVLLNHRRSCMRRQALLLSVLLCATPAICRAQDSGPIPARTASPLLLEERDAASDYARTQAIEHSDAYYTRLTIHRYGSYAILPLFAGEYYLGNKLINGTTDTNVKPIHRAVAYTIGGVFVVNTVTGVWNLIESRHDAEGRGRRLLHVGLMLAADAGFAYTGTLAGDASSSGPAAKRKHRNAALTSIGLATAGTLTMWLR